MDGWVCKLSEPKGSCVWCKPKDTRASIVECSATPARMILNTPSSDRSTIVDPAGASGMGPASNTAPQCCHRSLKLSTWRLLAAPERLALVRANALPRAEQRSKMKGESGTLMPAGNWNQPLRLFLQCCWHIRRMWSMTVSLTWRFCFCRLAWEVNSELTSALKSYVCWRKHSFEEEEEFAIKATVGA